MYPELQEIIKNPLYGGYLTYASFILTFVAFIAAFIFYKKGKAEIHLSYTKTTTHLIRAGISKFST